MSPTWSELITSAVQIGWPFSLLIALWRFRKPDLVLLGFLTMWFIGLANVWTGLQPTEDLLPHNIALVLQAIGKPVLVGLTISIPFGIWASRRLYLQSIRWIVLGLIGLYIILEVAYNDLLQRGFVVTYIGVLLGYAFTGVATWRLVRMMLSNLPADNGERRR